MLSTSKNAAAVRSIGGWAGPSPAAASACRPSSARAALALAAVVTCYVAMVESVIRAGGSLVWGDELLSVVLFTIAGGVFVLQYGSFQRRLGRIIDLFAGAEEGDFTNSYDVSADRAPDAITEVGRAYNRVRSQLASMVLSDPLTSCLNRRGLDQALARSLRRESRSTA